MQMEALVERESMREEYTAFSHAWREKGASCGMGRWWDEGVRAEKEKLESELQPANHRKCHRRWKGHGGGRGRSGWRGGGRGQKVVGVGWGVVEVRG